jgi:hypothetical protein
MDRDNRLWAALGIAAMGLGIALLTAPSLVAVGPVAMLEEAIASTGPLRVLLFVGVAVVVSLAVGLRDPSPAPEQSAADRLFARKPSHPAGTSVAGRQYRTGGGMDADIDVAIEEGGTALDSVQTQLRRTVVAVYTELYGTDEAVARRAVDRGEWCQDRLAAAFLAGEGGPSPTLGARLRLLAVPAHERRRRIERTVTAIEQLEDR